MSGTTNNLIEARTRFEDRDEHLVYLKAKEDYLSKQIDLDEGMKSVKIEQLKSLMQNNSGLNDTINNLMEKWEQIKKFSQPPGHWRLDTTAALKRRWNDFDKLINW